MIEPTGLCSPEDAMTPQGHAPNGFPSAHSEAFFRFMDKRIDCDDGRQPKSRNSIETLRPGVHRIRWECRREPETRKRIRRMRTVHGTRKQAQRRLREELSKVAKGLAPPDVRRTFGSWLKEHDRHWCNAISRRTRHGYRAVVQTYVPETLLGRSLEELSVSDLQTLFNDMTARGLSAKTVRGLRAVLRRALNRAMKLGLIDRNPATLVDLPKMARREIRTLTPEEVRRFLAAASGDRLEALWYVLVTVGLRPSEAYGLKWGDLDGDRLSVRRALVRVPGEPWSLEETKNRRARVVALPAMTVRALGEHQTRQKRERLQAGGPYTDHGLIFATTMGTPLDLNNVRKQFNRLLDAAALPRIRLYDLRHTAATLRLVNGEHPKLVQEMLGHASITLTMDTYSHVLPGMQEDSAARLDALLGEA